jgi:hypothetical protein
VAKSLWAYHTIRTQSGIAAMAWISTFISGKARAVIPKSDESDPR